MLKITLVVSGETLNQNVRGTVWGVRGEEETEREKEKEKEKEKKSGRSPSLDLFHSFGKMVGTTIGQI